MKSVHADRVEVKRRGCPEKMMIFYGEDTSGAGGLLRFPKRRERKNHFDDDVRQLFAQGGEDERSPFRRR